MAHLRKRHALPIYRQLLRFSPLVGVFGHRQVGKTTFVSTTVDRYLTFDEELVLSEAERSPRDFLKSNASACTAIDECQYSPKLFPALKEWVRVHRRPGQFVLTGSVRFSSRRAIRESLTGRLVSLDLYPLVVSELLEMDLPEALPKLLESRGFDENTAGFLRKPSRIHQGAFEKYLGQGGLPGLCFVRDPRLRREGVSSLVDLILDRDLRLVVQTTLSLETLRSFLRAIAAAAWKPYRYSEIRRELGISEITQKKLLYGFEAIHLLRRVRFLASKGETFLLEDQLEESYLSDGSLERLIQLQGAMFRNLRAQFGYRVGGIFHLESFRTRGGASVPLVIHSEGRRLGILPFFGDRPDLSQRRSVDSFLRRYPEAKVIYAPFEPIRPMILEPRVLMASAASLLTC